LSENGYVVIKNVLSADVVKECKDMMWDWLAKLELGDQKIDRNNPETWADKNWPADSRTGIVFLSGVGQTNFAWRVRSVPEIKKVFSKIWKTDDLITSFDGSNLFRPWQYKEQWRTEGQWWHVDQNAKRKESRGLQSVQGLVSLMDCDETVGGLCVIPKTHFIHDELCHRIKGGDYDFVPLPTTDRVFQDFSNSAVLVQCKAGDLCLWDSRTVHCNTPSSLPENENDKTEKKNWDLIRMVTYVCMTPRYKATNEVLTKRQRAFEIHSSSTHWPHYYFERPGTGYVDHKLQLYDGKPFVTLNEQQLSLVGKPRNATEEMFWILYQNRTNVVLISIVSILFSIGCGVFLKYKL